MDNMFSTSRTAQILDVSDRTLTRWYMWYENDRFKKPSGLKLPEYVRDSRGTRFFTMDAIQELEKFKRDLQSCYRGCMAEFNAYWQWGKRGKEIIKRKEEKFNESNGDSKHQTVN